MILVYRAAKLAPTCNRKAVPYIRLGSSAENWWALQDSNL